MEAIGGVGGLTYLCIVIREIIKNYNHLTNDSSNVYYQ